MLYVCKDKVLHEIRMGQEAGEYGETTARSYLRYASAFRYRIGVDDGILQYPYTPASYYNERLGHPNIFSFNPCHNLRVE